ncbi:MAG: sigma-E processing peptidase SpoIIGA [Acutalibacteraceae bacterium]|nr:sigma-E processing peptidase SpoIIGA [Oscillospiraceae bacterium]
MQVVYADVLIILNTYVNFALLRLAAVISGAGVNRLRLFLSALAGGVYSLVIFVDSMPAALSFALKIAVSALMVLIAFGYKNFAVYAKKFAAFFFVSFLFAGLMFALWIFVRPQTMLFNNQTVYFQFDTLTLLIATTVCYVLLRVICFITEKRAPKGHIYEITVCIMERSVTCNALLDSGSTLKDCFTSLPVIAADRSLFDFIPEDISEIPKKLRPRYIPLNTVSGDGAMLAVRPDKVRIRGVNCDFETSELFIGLSAAKIKNGDFEAVLPYEILEQREGKTYV